jgi:hypothetical protein
MKGMGASNQPPLNLEPLAISCTDSDCEKGLHCFRKTEKLMKKGLVGVCRTCGVSLVNWSRVHGRNISDVAFTFAELRKEYIRHYFWHLDIDQKAINHARRKGMIGLEAAASKRIATALAPSQPFRDGRQTPMRGNVLFYAQHATATCCRKCLEEWHAIPLGREMTPAEQRYCAELLMLYVKERLPTLTPAGEKEPAIRRRGIR